MSPLFRLLIGAGVFAASALWYYIVGTTAAWVVLAAGTGMFLLAVLHDERSR